MQFFHIQFILSRVCSQGMEFIIHSVKSSAGMVGFPPKMVGNLSVFLRRITPNRNQSRKRMFPVVSHLHTNRAERSMIEG